ncbi:hypothetical protein ABVT39_010750 [Epinephelus coioides]
MDSRLWSPRVQTFYPLSSGFSMPTLTSSPRCDHCVHLTQTIAELKGRISTLHKIRDEELFLESLVTLDPGAKVRDITDVLPGLLKSIPPSITHLVVHVGCNETARHQSEQTKRDFNILFRLLAGSGLLVWISGVLPVLSHSAERFSRLVALNSWIHLACSQTNFCLADNFNLFWNRQSFFWSVHPNKLGSSVLAANIQ